VMELHGWFLMEEMVLNSRICNNNYDLYDLYD